MVNIESLLNESARKASLKLGKKIDEEGSKLFKELILPCIEKEELDSCFKEKAKSKKRRRL